MNKSIKTKPESNIWVDVHDNELMINLGIHPPYIDPKVWSKTAQEKRMLRTFRNEHKRKMHISIRPVKSIPVEAKLIVYLRKNKYFPNTTYSTICRMHQISEVLNFFSLKKEDKITNFVTKYTYNGKTYFPNERPFWRII